MWFLQWQPAAAYIHLSWGSALAFPSPLWQSSSSYPISAPESDPKVMCGDEQKGGKQGGTAAKQLQLHCYCQVLQKTNGGKKESTK